jgi:hypothetical protein
MPSEQKAELARRADAIERSYEFLLAYAAQGLTTDQGNANSEQLREYLKRMDDALTGLGDLYRQAVSAGDLQPAEAYAAFIDVLARDAASAQAAIQLVRGQAGISSQVVDNLNASSHVRAMLTDLFLIDELINPRG